MLIGGLVAVGGLSLGLGRGWWRMNHPSPARYPVWGVDVSHHQGEIDWAAVAKVQQIGFAYVKATEGGDWIDPRFTANWQAARRAGLRVGGYHFFTFCRPALEQARHFLDVLPKEPTRCPPRWTSSSAETAPRARQTVRSRRRCRSGWRRSRARLAANRSSTPRTRPTIGSSDRHGCGVAFGSETSGGSLG